MKIAKTLGVAGFVLGVTFGIAVNSVQAADISEMGPSWTGPYVGLNIGYGWDDANRVDITPAVGPIPPDVPITPEELEAILQELVAAGSFPESLSPDAEGILGGVQAGYNWELPSGFVVGVEADIQASDIGGSQNVDLEPLFFSRTETAAEKKIDWFGTLRARAGFLVTPQWLLYATGGLAFGETSLNFKELNLDFPECLEVDICSDETSSGVKLGWTAGAGTEIMLSSNWSAKAEYLYLDLGKRSFVAESTTPIVFNVSSDYQEHIVRLGLNYHFN